MLCEWRGFKADTALRLERDFCDDARRWLSLKPRYDSD